MSLTPTRVELEVCFPGFVPSYKVLGRTILNQKSIVRHIFEVFEEMPYTSSEPMGVLDTRLKETFEKQLRKRFILTYSGVFKGVPTVTAKILVATTNSRYKAALKQMTYLVLAP